MGGSAMMIRAERAWRMYVKPYKWVIMFAVIILFLFYVSAPSESRYIGVEEVGGPRVVLVTGGLGFIGSHTVEKCLQRGDTVIIIDEVNESYHIGLKVINLEKVLVAAKSYRVPIAFPSNIQKYVEQEKTGGIVQQALKAAHVEYQHERAEFIDKDEVIEALSAYERVSGELKEQLIIYPISIETSGKLLGEIMERHNVNLVIHLAARAGVRKSSLDPERALRSNVEATAAILHQIQLRFPKENMPQVLFASSGSVYGNRYARSPMDERTIGAPYSVYALSKQSCEALGQLYAQQYGIRFTALRFFTVYGPRSRPDMAIFQFISSFKNGQNVKKYGNGNSFRDYTYVDDIVHGVLLAGDRRFATPFQVFNLGNASPVTLNQFIAILQEKFPKSETKIIETPIPTGDVWGTFAAVDKAEAILGFRGTVSFKEGIDRTINYILLADLPDIPYAG